MALVKGQGHRGAWACAGSMDPSLSLPESTARSSQPLPCMALAPTWMG